MRPLPEAIRAALADIESRVDSELRTDDYSRVLYSTDASIYQVEPYGVLFPRNPADLQAVVETAASHGLPLLPRTSGSSLAGQAVNEALVLDFSRHLDGILEVDPERRTVRVQPGIVLDDLNRRLRRYGLQFGPDPASSDRAAMGGIVSNNSTGSHSILYGMTADHVLEMNVLLADGSRAHFGPLEREQLTERATRGGLEGWIYRAMENLIGDRGNRRVIRNGTPRHWRRCGGYNLDRLVEGSHFHHHRDRRFNLAKLVCGGEGTLAVIEDVTLNLVPVPKLTALALLHFDSLDDALASVPRVLEAEPSAVELLDHMGLSLCRDVPRYARLLSTFVDGSPNCLLITEFYGESEAELKSHIERLAALLRRARVPATSLVPILDPAKQQDVWTVRKVGLGLLMSIKGDYKPIPFIEDAAVPVEHLSEYVSSVERFCNDLGTEVAYYAHASAGCIHIRPLINTKKASEVAKLPEILEFSVELLRGYGGSLSSEHGDGRARSWANQRFFGYNLYALYRQVKRIFDEKNLLNPGNIVDAPAMTESLRFGEDYRALDTQTILDFSAEQGFDRAVEMCNGAGVCRKSTGSMCPSFMVTREEEHSTRGRANALRAALSGALPADELTSARMHEVMDLCVECKACKAECPSSVDMAKIKFEFLARYNARHGVPLRSRLFGGIARWNRLASGRLAPLSNALLRRRATRRLLEKIGISERRELPELARQPFDRWFELREQPFREPTADSPRVALFNDTFNTYNHPRVARAAVELLERAGAAVELAGHRCCGRPLISKGLAGPARDAARDTVERLAPLAEAGVPIVGLEPSCILTLRDEYLYLLPDDPRARVVAEHAVTLEELLVRWSSEGPLDVEFTAEPRDLLLHTHCHQKALVGSGPTLGALSLPPNYRVAEIDSGCCGMAGSFGYESEHYHLSEKMAERRLWPAVEAAAGSTLIVAPGFSCRQQIEHGTERQALHPAEVLLQALA
jgi:FAD/FMN-containing dehydrogenase/Fe-S oxidoreductase